MTSFINIVCTDEPLLQKESCEQVIEQAKTNGANEREIVDVVEQYSWDDLLANSSNMSLFSETQLTDIRFVKPPKADAQKALVELLKTADQDNLFLIRLPKLDKRQKGTKWFKAISEKAQIQDLWPPKPYEYTGWVNNRAKSQGLNLDNDAAAMLAEQTEGNLLAASQTIEKLKMLFTDQAVNIEMLKEVVSDNARYSVFLCLDEALAGQGERAVKMLHKFKQESVAPISILVNLTREIGLCTQVSMAVQSGRSPMQALSKTFLWDIKKQAIVSASQRLPLVLWQKLSMRCAFLDRMVKGQEKGNIWQELESCMWLLSGKKIWGRQ
jgi:DNA polymerase-3 subunit delta